MNTEDYTGSGMTREQAVEFILKMIAQPLASRLMYDKAMQQASEHEITAIELLRAAKEKAQST
jgi:hypothetical protein